VPLGAEGAIGFGPPVLAFPNSAETEEVCDGGVQAVLPLPLYFNDLEGGFCLTR